jgi:hypothetical protein
MLPVRALRGYGKSSADARFPENLFHKHQDPELAVTNRQNGTRSGEDLSRFARMQEFPLLGWK